MVSNSIDISGLNKADVLAALFNNARPLGMGFIHYKKRNMDRAEAEKLLETHKYFDYLEGRVMKVDLSGDELRTGGYDCDNGKDAAMDALSQLLAQSHVTPG
jgi:hypothetical protein